MEWLDDTKQQFEAMFGVSAPSDDAALKVLVSVMAELKSKFKNEMSLINMDEVNIVNQIIKCDKSGGAVYWKSSIDGMIKCVTTIHGYTFTMIEVLEALHGIHPTAPGAVWIPLRVLFDNTPDTTRIERKDIADGLDMSRLDNTVSCNDAKELLRRYVMILQKLREFEVELCRCIDEICQYMESYDTASTSPTERIRNANDTTKDIISDLSILRAMAGVV